MISAITARQQLRREADVSTSVLVWPPLLPQRDIMHHASLFFVLVSSGTQAAVLPSTSPTRLLTLRGGGGPVSSVASVKTPKEAYLGLAAKGADNAKLPILKTLHQSIMAGCYVSFVRQP